MTGQFETSRLVLVPLTPVHVGGGEESVLRPETYRLTDKALEVFSPWAALSALPAGPRSATMRDLLRDPLTALRTLRERVPQDAVLERIGVSRDSRAELEKSMELARHGQQRSGTVNAFQRDGSAPVLPGSTLKGALRTAWLARCAEGITALSGRGSQRSGDLVRRAFALGEGKRATDTDPFRDVSVSDVRLPPEATRIDRIRTWKRTRERSGAESAVYGFDGVGQMHWERLVSVIDGKAPPLLEVDICLRAAAVRRERTGRKPDLAPRPDRSPEGIEALLVALNEHHLPIWRHELEKTFFAGTAGDRLRAAMALFEHLDLSGGDPDAALVRLGRGGHAESKSVAAFREVHRPQAKTREGKVAKQGTTRHVVDLAGSPGPFGWVLLVRAERWAPPGTWLAEPGRAQGPRSAAPRAGGAREGSSARAAGPTFLYRKGDRVTVGGEPAIILEDVPPNATEVNVEIDGSTEPIKLYEIDE